MFNFPKIVSEYDQEIPQSQTADNPLAPRGRAALPSRDTKSAQVFANPFKTFNCFDAPLHIFET